MCNISEGKWKWMSFFPRNFGIWRSKSVSSNDRKNAAFWKSDVAMHHGLIIKRWNKGARWIRSTMNSATTQRWFTFDKKRKPLLMFETKCQGKWDISTCQYSRQFAMQQLHQMAEQRWIKSISTLTIKQTVQRWFTTKHLIRRTRGNIFINLNKIFL